MNTYTIIVKELNTVSYMAEANSIEEALENKESWATNEIVETEQIEICSIEKN